MYRQRAPTCAIFCRDNGVSFLKKKKRGLALIKCECCIVFAFNKMKKNTFLYQEGSIADCPFQQIVQEYERAVIFRLGRLLPGGAKGPGRVVLITSFPPM